MGGWVWVSGWTGCSVKGFQLLFFKALIATIDQEPWIAGGGARHSGAGGGGGG